MTRGDDEHAGEALQYKMCLTECDVGAQGGEKKLSTMTVSYMHLYTRGKQVALSKAFTHAQHATNSELTTCYSALNLTSTLRFLE